MLPPDGHVHTEWSWDTADGSMEQSCARAVELGLPSIAFTEHADFTRWVISPEAAGRMRVALGLDRAGWPVQPAAPGCRGLPGVRAALPGPVSRAAHPLRNRTGRAALAQRRSQGP